MSSAPQCSFFKLLHEDKATSARIGRLMTAHGLIETPVFMPVGTLGTLKAIDHQDLLNQSVPQILLCNTYHLYLRPGLDVIHKAGGLHAFMNWPRALLSDSGGFQVFSLARHVRINDTGVCFNSHLDGGQHVLTPQRVIDYQRLLGTDIMIALDDCPPAEATKRYVADSLTRTHQWFKQSKLAFGASTPLYGYAQYLWPVIQGGTYLDLRQQAIDYFMNFDVKGYAIGGLSVGEPAEVMYEVVESVCAQLPTHHPRYLMGVGKPENLLECISYGIDMFDCVLPTRNARNGTLFTTKGVINIRNAKWKYNYTPIDEPLQNAGYLSPNYTLAYLRHLHMSSERLADTIASKQNLAFYFYLVNEAKKHIQNGTFKRWKNNTIPRITQKC